MSISEKAITAAAKAAYQVSPAKYFRDDSYASWEQLGSVKGGPAIKDLELRKARQALEAALPHIKP